MASLRFIDHPVSISVNQYDALKEKLTAQLLEDEAVLSVYQMGSVKHPGISDLDLICVFKNGSNCTRNYRTALTPSEKDILTHGIFGISEEHLQKSMEYTLISNLKHLGGKALQLNENFEVSKALKQQIALEYLVKMLVTIDMQITFKVVKLRAFLLLAKAVQFDLELLGIKRGELFDLVQKVIDYRSIWYKNQPSKKDVEKLIIEFHKALKLFLENEFKQSKLYFPERSFKFPGNFTISKSETFSTSHNGILIPSLLSFIGRKYINLQHRLNSFSYQIPFELPMPNSEQYNRFEFSKKMVMINRNNYPSFIPLTTSLSIY